MKNDKTIAFIDIGSHSIKMHIGEKLRKDHIRQIEYLWVPVAIGRDTFSRGMVGNATIQEVISVVKRFKEVMGSYHIGQFRAVATSSIREASNVDVLIDRVQKATGIHVETIEPIEETEAIYEGVKSLLKNSAMFAKKNVVLFSIGAGSSEIVLQSKGSVIFSESHHMGTLRLIRDYDVSESSHQLTLRPLSLGFANTIKRFPGIKGVDRFIAVNDDLLGLVQKRFPELLKDDVYCIPSREFNELYYEVEKSSLDEMKTRYQLNENVLKTTRIAVYMVAMFFNMTKTPEILIPDVSTSFFMMNYLFCQRDGIPLAGDLYQNILSSAMAIGLKYQFDEEHARAVADYALSIFDQLRETYNLTDRERIYLEVASLLHDIGSFIGSSSHNKHSQQLILSSEIMGLQANEMRMIALVARYHRKSPPKPAHQEYNELPTEERLIVSRLSGILRVADALDTTHNQVLQEIRLNLQNDRCEFLLRMKERSQDFIEIFRQAVKKKSDLFESFYGLSVKVERRP
jgi:exopolyphosphatase/guanosine-5'-triphosphate,3'-diphosphate pyrophosphatase